nr:hypothetical protein [Pandoravirus belohorizontensis]
MPIRRAQRFDHRAPSLASFSIFFPPRRSRYVFGPRVICFERGALFYHGRSSRLFATTRTSQARLFFVWFVGRPMAVFDPPGRVRLFFLLHSLGGVGECSNRDRPSAPAKKRAKATADAALARGTRPSFGAARANFAGRVESPIVAVLCCTGVARKGALAFFFTRWLAPN